MIVMKFGGSSLESAPAIRRVTGIVKSRIASNPVVVVSALGKTTDRLVAVASEAERGHSYLAWKGLKDLREFHAGIAAEVARGESLDWLDHSLHRHCNRLHQILVSMEDGETRLTPALQDTILSYGEILSSETMAAALQCAGVPSLHLDSRQLIVTDEQFTRAAPLYWETYAKLRRTIPLQTRVVVMGGFIGATESGATTTLGRGGSDLTASLVGAGICAEEIQIWTDVDGMLTCDPKLFEAPYRIKSISYGEAAAMAQAGAKVLHPDTIAPAIRQRVPISIRNSRRPEVEGTVIASSVEPCGSPVKSIAVKQGVTVLEMRSPGGAGVSVENLQQLCERQGISRELLAGAEGAVYLGVKSGERYDRLRLDMNGCVQVRLHPERAILTLVGPSEPGADLASRVLAALRNPEAFAIGGPSLTVVVPQRDLRKSVAALHRELFAQVDRGVFAEVERPRVQEPAAVVPENAPTIRELCRQRRSTLAHS
jgi:aspartate kinase